MTSCSIAHLSDGGTILQVQHCCKLVCNAPSLVALCIIGEMGIHFTCCDQLICDVQRELIEVTKNGIV